MTGTAGLLVRASPAQGGRRVGRVQTLQLFTFPRQPETEAPRREGRAGVGA